MMTEITTITLPLSYRMGNVNCYLLTNTERGYILIDTGSPNSRRRLVGELERHGCKPGNLSLIIITHGDFDHTGNAAYLRNKYVTKIVMHRGDSGMAEYGDMFFNRKKRNFLLRILVKMLSSIFFGFGKAERFKPDLYPEDGNKLMEYGLDARIIDIPGHSAGSIGILTDNGCLFCGDLLINDRKLSLNSLIDAPAAANASIEKLMSLKIKTVYPGHGKPFPLEALVRNPP